MNTEQLLLTLVSEECNEVGQRCSKATRFGMDEVQHGQELDNKERLINEFNDLIAVMEVLFKCDLAELIDKNKLELKKEKIEHYLQYSKELGMVS